MGSDSSTPQEHFDVGIAPEGYDQEEEKDHDPDCASGVEVLIGLVVAHGNDSGWIAEGWFVVVLVGAKLL
jgi:hypothetical protein